MNSSIFPDSKPKRADRRSSMTILMLGDDSVGKSSLISTFVSRYFSDVVPGIMTRVRLPPDPELDCVTVICDSQNGDAALVQAMRQHQQHPSAMLGSTDSLAALVERAEEQMKQQEQKHQQQTAPTTPVTSALSAPASSSTSPERRGSASVASTGSNTQQQHQQQRQYHHHLPLEQSKPLAYSGMEDVDSIVLVYDLDRVETFFRLEQHWLPLIERCFKAKIPVIIAENKMDLFRPSGAAGMNDEQALARKRQQIVSLMQRFPFVRQCIKCSAKTLLRVDDVFLKAQQAVLYPFTPPLYDLENACLATECKRALTRIFRMYDADRDGLLSQSELDRFQRETYQIGMMERDTSAWKKVVTRHNPTEVVLRDGKYTVEGFFTIFDVFISRNRLDVVWQALRKFHYDDDMNLHVPESVTDDPILAGVGWKLSNRAKKFLAATFTQFDEDNDGVLTAENVSHIFSILSPPGVPPWHSARAPLLFAGCFSLPKQQHRGESSVMGDSVILPGAASASPPQTPLQMESISKSGLSILSASDSLPSVTLSGISGSEPLSFLQWMGHWHTMAAISPAVARAELFRLGHTEEKVKENRRRSRKKKADEASTPTMCPDATLPSCALRVMVLGNRACGKTTLISALCDSLDGDVSVLETATSTTHPETSATFVKIRRVSTGTTRSGSSSSSHDDKEEIVVHLIFTDVPEAAAASQETHYRELGELFGSTTTTPHGDRICDLAMLVFDSTSPTSFEYAKGLESTLLTKDTPRVFVATKTDAISPTSDDTKGPSNNAMCAAESHCAEYDLESPLMTSVMDDSTADEKRQSILDHLARCALVSDYGIDRLKSRPHEERQRREAARRRKMIWLGGIVSVGVVAAVAVGLIFNGQGGAAKKEKGGFGWLRSFFGGRGGSVRQASA